MYRVRYGADLCKQRKFGSFHMNPLNILLIRKYSNCEMDLFCCSKCDVNSTLQTVNTVIVPPINHILVILCSNLKQAVLFVANTQKISKAQLILNLKQTSGRKASWKI